MAKEQDDTEMVRLSELLSTCVEACLLGMEEIRKVQSSREAGASIDYQRKIADDPRSALTEADLNSQHAIISALSQRWPTLNIVGEEDGGPHDESAWEGVSIPELKGCELDGEIGKSEHTVPMSTLCIFVDPVDGTREFVEGRLQAVQTLIGVSYMGRSIAGAVGIPFPEGQISNPPSVVYALVGAGVGRYGFQPPATVVEDQEGWSVTTGDSKVDTIINAAVAVAQPPRRVVMGAAGNKVLSLSQGRADVAIINTGTCLWDTCAPEAILRANGGTLTDLFGAPILHLPPPHSSENKLGVLASSGRDTQAPPHSELTEKMRSEPTLLALFERAGLKGEGAQACDVARGLSGKPLTLSWIEEAILPKGETGVKLVSYSAPEESAERGLMSDVCRLELVWEGSKPGLNLPKSVFYKRVVMGDLEHARLKARTMPAKLSRDSKSFEVEAGFLGSQACSDLIAKGGVHVARAYAAMSQPCLRDPIEGRFALLLEDLGSGGWQSQPWLLDPSQARASLSGLAKLHAFFWEGSSFWKSGGKLEETVWPSGGYWQPSMQGGGEYHLLGERWKGHAERFAKPFEADEGAGGWMEGVSWRDLGERLQACAAEAGSEAHPFDVQGNGGKYKTLLHGDPKAANLFFREAHSGGGGAGVEAGMIDFQWCGFGLASTEVAHHIVAALRIECLSRDGSAEESLLDFYHSELCSSLALHGVAASPEAAADLYPRSLLGEQYATGVLDMCRCIFGYQWERIKASPESLEKNAKSRARNSYNKSMPHAMWVVRTCDRLLKEREARAAGSNGAQKAKLVA